MINTIEGTWRSHYEYGQGTDNAPQASEHEIEFVRENDTWVAVIDSPDGSDRSEVWETIMYGKDAYIYPDFWRLMSNYCLLPRPSAA